MSTVKWKKHQILGSGSFGTVHVASPSNEPNSTNVVAVKSASFPHSDSLKKETKFLYELRGCPEIVQCFGDDISVENNNEVYNVMLEFAPGGTLSDLINIPGKMSERLVAFYTRMILKGLSNIHQSFVHCDIKPRNILVFPMKDGTNHLKIADFGLAKDARVEIDSYRGTLVYSSPESVEFGVLEAATDIWSLGCTVIEMITGEKIWKNIGRQELINEIVRGEPIIPQNISDIAKDFLQRCLAKEQQKRWTADKLLNHPFIVDNFVKVAENCDQEVFSCINPLGSCSWISTHDLFSTHVDITSCPGSFQRLFPSMYLNHDARYNLRT
ncbi:mitogen-activated protein kinase kinase kinase 21 [Abeliophyllum distichum]|uniref:Mitogen-activated protein kinase kinase kinase 21 n=1 Tax=Abeliophyllum distichum TaxID=126358 RepID=A0ABD1SDC7_9LAMI